MMYKINEIFYSPQGEGARSGTANVFIRFAGCNLTCGFCDTEFESGVDMTAGEIAQAVKVLMPHPRAVILTGGEPLLTYDMEIFRALKSQARVKTIACETNGSVVQKAPLGWISCSPKVAEHVLVKNFPNGVDELRYVRHKGQGIPECKIKATHYFLSPEFNGNEADRENLDWCIRLIKENPTWRISVQMHKLWHVR